MASDKQRWQSSTGGKVEGIGATCTSVSGKAEHRRRHRKKLTAVPRTSLRLDRGKENSVGRSRASLFCVSGHALRRCQCSPHRI
uniref:Uncharacterized protein n=1 Tax=Brassica campestris TaxID=3711 RepID=M4EMH8_BRACM